MRQPSSRTILVLAAFAAVYLIWGSTYLAIRFAVDTIPPFFMAGARVLAAGLVLLAWARGRGAPAPTLLEWRNGLITGGLMLCGGTGLLAYAQQEVPSGLAALMIATIPFWMAVLDPLLFGGPRVGPVSALGLLMGFAGVAILVDPTEGAVLGGIRPFYAAVLVSAALFWTVGSLLSRKLRQPSSHALSAGLQLTMGGFVLLIVGLLRGEAADFAPADVTAKSWFSLAYLTVLGSIVAYNAYLWLLKNVAPTLVATYAFVNPVVAVVLGWGLAEEALTTRSLLASVIIVAAVALITIRRPTTTPKAPSAEKRDASLRPQPLDQA